MKNWRSEYTQILDRKIGIFQRGESSYEMKMERMRLPYSIIPFESKAALKAQMLKEEERATAHLRIRAEARKAIAVSYIEEQNAKSDARVCTCDGGLHSTWCPAFKPLFVTE